MQRLMSLAAASVLLWGLADTHGLATEQQQDQQPALDGLREGIQMVEDGDYAAPSEMARSYFYAGVARVFIVGDDEARFAFHEAQQHDPQFRPTADQFPRRVIRLWEEASTMEVEAESLAGGEAAGTLTVITEPGRWNGCDPPGRSWTGRSSTTSMSSSCTCAVETQTFERRTLGLHICASPEKSIPCTRATIPPVRILRYRSV